MKISFTAISVMILCSLPWIWQLHNKYGIWTTSTSGSLNMSWYLVGHPYWKEGIGILLPPVYPDSPYYWEDPWYVNGKTPHFWDSWHLFGLQVLRIGLNIWKFIVSSLQLSVFFIAIVGYVKWILIWKRSAVLDKNLRIVMLSMLLFPLGYVLVNFESRYLWYMVPLVMVVGGLYLQQVKNSALKNLGPLLFAVSFLIYPTWGMMKMYDEGKNEFRNAALLKKNGMTGNTFTSNAKPGLQTQRMVRLAYFSGLQYYAAPKPVPANELMNELRRFSINYYFVFDKDTISDENGSPPPEIHIQSGDITVLKLN